MCVTFLPSTVIAFSREHSIRLETASLFKQLIHNQFISSDVIEKCIPEFLIRLTDTRGEIRAAYSTLLEVVPTCVLTSFARGKKVSVPKSGQKGIESLRSSYGTWLARKGHMTRPSQATFHGHHFKAIMGFILQGYAPRSVCTGTPTKISCTHVFTLVTLRTLESRVYSMYRITYGTSSLVT